MTANSLVLLLCLMLTLSCGGETPDVDAPDPQESKRTWSRVADLDLDETQRAQRARAVAAKDELARIMMGELKGELESGGPPGAVVVCRDMAPMIAEHVSTEHGLLIGRTSHRLRNTANRPPSWAVEVVSGEEADPVNLAGPKGELGVMLPIELGKACLACHGQVDSMDEALRAALADNYPDDHAVGFNEGDLRGWFWVEVPPEEGPST